MILVDSHCHLDMLIKEGVSELDLFVQRAAEKGVKYLQTICTDLENFPNILAIAQRYPNVYASVGVHPNEVKEQKISAQHLVNLSLHEKVIGLGETGLDYYYETTSKVGQIESFQQHIIAAQQTDLPVIVHTRDAEEDTIDIITSAMRDKPFRCLIHCFTASEAFAKKMLELGVYISVAGIVTFKNAESLKSIVQSLPLSSLLIETDSPYLAPVPMRGKQNEPAFVLHVAEYIAELKGLAVEEVAKQTTDNFFKLFSKAVPNLI